MHGNVSKGWAHQAKGLGFAVTGYEITPSDFRWGAGPGLAGCVKDAGLCSTTTESSQSVSNRKKGHGPTALLEWPSICVED